MEHRTKRGSIAITQDDWMGALHDLGLEDIQLDDPNALTVRQLAKLWNCSECQARQRTNKLIRMNKAKRIQIYRTSDEGTPRRVYAYILVKS